MKKRIQYVSTLSTKDLDEHGSHIVFVHTTGSFVEHEVPEGATGWCHGTSNMFKDIRDPDEDSRGLLFKVPCQYDVGFVLAWLRITMGAENAVVIWRQDSSRLLASYVDTFTGQRSWARTLESQERPVGCEDLRERERFHFGWGTAVRVAE